jgi:hypothetical protein
MICISEGVDQKSTELAPEFQAHGAHNFQHCKFDEKIA